ncbi:MAG: ATP-binding cassette domain-containing protein, partial [Nitrospirae bacterium]
PEGRDIFSELTVLDNLYLGAYHRYSARNKKALEEDLQKVLELFPALKELLNLPAGTLSGGQQQMLAIARGLMARPRMLLLDEPSTGLAPVLVKEIFNYIKILNKEIGLTVLLVEQNARAALKVADRAYIIETGRIVLEGKTEDLLQSREVERAYLGKDLDVQLE